RSSARRRSLRRKISVLQRTFLLGLQKLAAKRGIQNTCFSRQPSPEGQESRQGDRIMVAGLTLSERRLALVILFLLGLTGLAMAAAGRGDLMGAHGFVVLVFALGVAWLVMAGFYAPEPGEERLARYYDDPTKAGIVLTMAWAVFGMFFGVWVSA